MTNEQAGAVLGLPLPASAGDIESRYQELYSEYQLRIDNAPTAMLRQRYARVLNEVEEARQTLLRGVAQPAVVDLPSDRRVPTWETGGEHIPPTYESPPPTRSGGHLGAPGTGASPQPHRWPAPPNPPPRGPISLPEPPQKSRSKTPLIIGGVALLLLIVKVATSGNDASASASTTVSDTSAGTIAPAPPPETDTTPNEWNGWTRFSTVRDQMRRIDSIAASHGLHREEVSFISHGVGEEGGDYYTDVTFPSLGPGAYLLAAFCDARCSQMRLEVRDTVTGRVVDRSDDKPTDSPVVTFAAPTTATYRVVSHIDKCLARSCNFAVRAYTAPSP